MGLNLVEVRESNSINNEAIAGGINQKTFASKEELIQGLLDAGLPESKLWLIRVYPVDDFIGMVNDGESFDKLASIQLEVKLDSERLVEY